MKMRRSIHTAKTFSIVRHVHTRYWTLSLQDTRYKMAASKRNDFCPYATVLTTGIFRVFSYLKEYDDCF